MLSESKATQRQRGNISGYLRENPASPVTTATIPALLELRTPTVAAKAAKALNYLAKRVPRPGSLITVNWESKRELAAAVTVALGEDVSSSASDETLLSEEIAGCSWVENDGELEFLLNTYLTTGTHRLAFDPTGGRFIITPAGWEFVDSNPESSGTVAFVAMSFDPTLLSVFLEVISPAVEAAGYTAFRVDRKEHNEDITDEILAGIRTSKFVIADFTNHRAGVYYEAGFAAGLGKAVVRSVRADHMESLHFDTRQLSHITWETDKPDQFRKALTDRIVATIGRGPLLVRKTS